MENLIKKSNQNLGGVVELMAIPVSSFLRIREDYKAGTKHLEVKERENIILMPAEPENKVKWEEVHELADGGDLWTIKVSGIVPNVDSVDHKLEERLQRGRWLVLTRTSNGCVRLSGSCDTPMRFITNTGTGENAASLNAMAFSFECSQAEPSVVLSLGKLIDL